MQRVEHRTTGDRLQPAIQVIGSGDAGIEGAKIACIEIIARIPVDSRDVEKAAAEAAAVLKPQDIGGQGNRCG